MLGLPSDVSRATILKRAHAAILNRAPAPPERIFIRHDLAKRVMALARAEGDVVAEMLYCCTYALMFRCRSEALPLVCGGDIERRLPEGGYILQLW